jgi:hypothetical protein
MDPKWFKYSWVCTGPCDALIEYTMKAGYTPNVTDITCLCGSATTLLSVEDATIKSTTTEGAPMLDNLEATINFDSTTTNEYNPNQLVTYKVLNGYSDPEYTTAKVTSLEWDLHNGRQAQKRVGLLESNNNAVKEIITESYAESEDQETLRSIAEALGIELTRTVEWTATIEVSGTMDIDLLEDVDIEQEIYDNLYVDSQNGNIEIGDTEVCNAREC